MEKFEQVAKEKLAVEVKNVKLTTKKHVGIPVAAGSTTKMNAKSSAGLSMPTISHLPIPEGLAMRDTHGSTTVACVEKEKSSRVRSVPEGLLPELCRYDLSASYY